MGLSPQFRLISKPSLYRSVSDALSALLEIEPPVRPITLNSGTPWPRDRSLLPAFLTSLLINFAVYFFLYSVPLASLFNWINHNSAQPEHHYSVVIYELQMPDLAPYLPAKHPPEAGGAPASPASAGKRTPQGSTTWDSRVSIVSNPKRPDNFRQTILQRNTPLNVKLQEEVQLPDLVIPPAPKPPLEVKLPPLQQLAVPTPMALQTPAMPVITQPQTVRPALPTITPLPLAPAMALNKLLPPPLPPPLSPPKQTLTASRSPVSTQVSPPARLLSLSVSPAPLKDVIALPLGNRMGAFSISPLGSKRGSTGGTPGGRAGAGHQGNGPGDDASVSSGPGGPGGGGTGNSETGGTYSISGASPGASASVAGMLSPLGASALVYPVNSPPPLRQPALIVSTGPGGGGGLGVYGVLQCGRIFTIYLNMHPRNWILQFCSRQADPPSPSSRIVEIRMAPSLTPPAPRHQFDFHRPTLPGSKADQLVILRGTIGKDGSVGGLRILRDVSPAVDQVAMAAFGRWKFSPALRNGEPVAVEILVGIPVAGP